MDPKNSFVKDIKLFSEIMKLSVIKSDIEVAIEDANSNNLSYEEFLYGLLQKEVDIRNYTLIQSSIKTASFPYKNI